MKYILLILSFTTLFCNTYSQKPTVNSLNRLIGLEGNKLRYDEINGSPYYLKQFTKGEVYFNSQEEPQEYLLNYDAYADQFTYLEKSTTYIVSNPVLIKKIIINNDIFIYTKYNNFKEQKEGYFIVLIDDYVSLYKRESVTVIPSKNTAYNSTPDKSGEFLKGKPMYYISIYGQPLHLIKNKKNLLELLFNNEDLKRYIKEEKIKFHSEVDLIKLVTFLNNYDKK